MASRNQKKKKRFEQLLGTNAQFVSSSQAVLGDYQDQGYGIITLSDENGRLMANIGKARFPVVENGQGQSFIEVKIADALIPIAISAHEISVLTEPELQEPTVFAKV